MSTVNDVSQSSFLSEYAIEKQEAQETETDKDMFMRLMLAQLQNQNPLNPQDGTEFTSQLAQFSTLESIANLNTSVQDIASMYRSTQALQATALVGREVLLNTSEGYLDYTGELTGVIHTDGVTAQDAKVVITNANGEVVRTFASSGSMADGEPFTWDGTDENGNRLPPGKYNIAVDAMVGGNRESLRVSTHARVNSVSIVDNSGDMLLNLNGGNQISSSEIKQIR